MFDSTAGSIFFYRYTKSYEYHMKLAQKYLLEEDYEQAIAEYEIAISIDLSKKEAYAELADIYLELEEYEEALEILEEGYEETETKSLNRKIEMVKELYAQEEKEAAQEAVSFDAQKETSVEAVVTEMPETEKKELDSAVQAMEYVQVPDSIVSPTDIYTAATNKSATEVEEYAQKVRQLFLDHKWSNLAEMIVFPIEIGGITYASTPDFIQGGFDSKYNESFMQALEAETCVEMYCDSNGIRLGNGEVWIADVFYNGSMQLKIVSINH